MNATREYAIPSFQNRRLRRDYVLATKVNREEWKAIKGTSRKEEKNNLGFNSLSVSGRDSKDSAIAVYSEYLPKCIYAVRQTQELLTQHS